MRNTPDHDDGQEQADQDITTADVRAVLAGLGVDTHLTIGEDGQSGIRLDRSSIEQLRDTASAHGAFTIAAALDIALAEAPDSSELGGQS